MEVEVILDIVTSLFVTILLIEVCNFAYFILPLYLGRAHLYQLQYQYWALSSIRCKTHLISVNYSREYGWDYRFARLRVKNASLYRAQFRAQFRKMSIESPPEGQKYFIKL